MTPEAVVLEIETAGVASRLGAALLDLAISLGVLMVLSMVIGIVAVADGSLFQTVVLVMVFVLLLVVPVVEQVWMRGRTIGKAAFGLRAVTLDGSPIRFRHAVLRTMGGLVDRLMPPGGITGVLFVLGTARSQSVGDLLAGTIVVRVPERLGAAAVWFPVPPGLEAFAATIDPTRITDEQYTVVRAFLLRARSLSESARMSVARDLADRVAAAVGAERPPGIHPESYLLCAMSRVQRRNFPDHQPSSWGGR